ncbi:MAG: lysophospholipase [Candidatus Babeliaceae bacterium]|nr:lysophospholipase [Candidatus Babeliaceae bacterium]
MNTKNKFFKWLIIPGAVIVGISFFSAIYIEKIFSKRIHYKNPEFIISERQRMIQKFGAQEVTLETKDKTQIAGLYIKRPAAKRIFLICHGFKHSKEFVTGFLDIFPEDTIFFIDFRGHGQSAGDQVSLGLNEYLDVIAAVEYIKTNVSAAMPLFGLGISMGGSAVMRAAAAGAPFNGIISDSAPSSFKDTISCVLQKTRHIPFPIGFLALTWYEFEMACSLTASCYIQYAAKITCPVLIMHDEHDHLINYKHAEKIFDSLASTCKMLYTPSGTRHGKMHQQIPSEYKKVVEHFIDACCTR